MLPGRTSREGQGDHCCSLQLLAFREIHSGHGCSTQPLKALTSMKIIQSSNFKGHQGYWPYSHNSSKFHSRCEVGVEWGITFYLFWIYWWAVSSGVGVGGGLVLASVGREKNSPLPPFSTQWYILVNQKIISWLSCPDNWSPRFLRIRLHVLAHGILLNFAFI